MSDTNWWGITPKQINKKKDDPLIQKGGEIEKVGAIHESDRVRARVAVMRGESELYFIKIPPDINMAETRPAGGDLYEIVYHDIVYGYTSNRNAFGTSKKPETYN